MKTTLALLAALLFALPARAADGPLRRATVQLRFVTREPDWGQPWQFARQGSGTGSGVVIAGHRILTNAHVVANATYLTARKAGDVKNYPARVQFVAHDGETALVTVDDPSFFDGTTPAVFGDLPAQRDKLVVYGFPTGGTELSITEGTVSRVGVVSYAHSGRRLLAIQTDAAINPGNSGGPVFQGGKLVGIAFQHLSSPGAENIGYAVPVPLIERFLADVKDGSYHGIPALGVNWQETENPALRRSLGLPDDATGVLVSKVQFGSTAWGLLQPGDALTRLDGVAVGQNGTVPLRGDERVDLGDLVARHQIGDRMDAVVVRGGKTLAVPLTLKKLVELVPGPQHDAVPGYFVLGGFVFMTLSEDFFRAHNGGTYGLRAIAADDVATPERTQAVVLSQVLADEVNRGYHGWGLMSVAKLNGRPIGRLKDLVEAAKHPVDGRHAVEFDNGTVAVLDAAAAAKALPAILARYGAARDRSPDLE
ncbi:MAG: trypsin-like peptidase domain-containing protein [Elusimicrobia bacterium]|nr:trypsin-like peptidase domain-containing protein [Elusimicrobiota bacterium]